MKITKGKWQTKNGHVVKIERDKEGYYAIFEWWNRGGGVKDIFFYDDDGRCYRDKRLDVDGVDVSKTPENSSIFANWDLIELVEEEIEVLKRNSNPIFTLDLCTE